MGHYRVRARFGDVEIEVDSSDREYADTKLKELMGALGAPKGAETAMSGRRGPAAAAAEPRPQRGKAVSMVEYVRSLRPKSGSQYVIAVGSYLEQHGGMRGGFRTKDIVAGFRAVKYKHANPAEAIRQARHQGFLMDGPEVGTLLVTHTAEAWAKGQLAGNGEAG